MTENAPLPEALDLPADIGGFLRNAWVVNGLVGVSVVAAAVFFEASFLYVALGLPFFYICRARRLAQKMPKRFLLDAHGVTVFWASGEHRRFERADCDIRSEVTVLRGIEECSLTVSPKEAHAKIRLPLAEEHLAAVQQLLGEI